MTRKPRTDWRRLYRAAQRTYWADLVLAVAIGAVLGAAAVAWILNQTP